MGYNDWLVTPRYVLGSDSFCVGAETRAEAVELAKARIAAEGWHSPMGWELYCRVPGFDDDND